MKWQVQVTLKKSVLVEVEADSRTEADNQAAAQAAVPGYEADARTVRQLGEPWCRSSGWYDLHGPGDVIVVDRAFGNVFTAREVGALQGRLVRIGLRVAESWNGAGFESVSFRCLGRKGTRQMTKAQLAALTAPLRMSRAGARKCAEHGDAPPAPERGRA